MREAEQYGNPSNALNIVHTKVERSLLCLAIGQINLNLTLSFHRLHPVVTLALVPLFFTLIALCAPGTSYGQMRGINTSVPSDLAKQLRPFANVSASVEKDVLRVILPRPVVRRAGFFQPMYFAYCSPVWGGEKAAWGGKNLQRLEVMNEGVTQGFAFVADKAACMQIGRTTDDKAKAKLIEERTWVCVAGNPCRPRGQGEITATDE